MNRAKDKISAMLNAITFAEAGDTRHAQEFLEESSVSAEPFQETETRRDTSLFRKVQAHMAAVAFAEGGDFATAGDFVQAGTKSRAVLLVIEGGDPNDAAFRYAMGLCTRMDAHMNILLVMRKTGNAESDEIPVSLRESVQQRLAPLVQELELSGMAFSLILCRGDLREKLFEFAQQHTDIRMVVYDSPKAREESAVTRGWHRMIETISRRLSIPLVVVSAKQPVGECP